MEKICKNCVFFVQISDGTRRHVWGDCTKAADSTLTDSEKEPGVFTWAEKACDDFERKPKTSLTGR